MPASKVLTDEEERVNERTVLLSPAAQAADYEAIAATKAARSLDDRDPQDVTRRATILIFLGVWTGVFLGALDTTVVATIFSQISSSFGASNQSSWLATSYLLATATCTPLYGRLSDIFGRRGASMLALTLFTVGTLLCGLAGSMETLIVARLIAGMGGGGLMTTSSIIASDLIPLKQRGFVQGLVNICFGAGAGLGGPLGGLIADRLGWRWAFLMQIPPLIVCFVLVFIFVRYRVPGQTGTLSQKVKRVDWAGSATLVIAVASLLLGLSFKNNEDYAWSSPWVWAPLIIWVVFTLIFGLVEAYVSPEPVMPLRLLRQRSIFFIALSNFIASAISFSVLYFYPLFFESVKLSTAGEAGLHLLPNSVALSIGSLVSGYLMRRTGKYWWLIVGSAGLPIVAFIIMVMLDRNSPAWLTWIAVIPSGFGYSSLITSLLIALISTADRADMATATGLSYLFRYVGQVVGVALSSSFMQSILTSQLRANLTGPGSAELIEKIRHTTSIVKDLPPDTQSIAIDAYQKALRAVYLLNGGLAILGLLCAFPIREVPLSDSFEEEEQRRREREDAQSTET
ncbi:uncharacterized protein L969DRAFT_19050 [Mixia osmundae IAM 14324]|uniref:Major facilitator superfamily (MFS) profile domain-containing protein n=1 Tax=Mixia osmundae (strain CBS 9802 / IAM 14324 / JCM 22182 / KY 12970) TaxID=764103 RepID=G7DS18_MIXOS|nr:uncharacterized protein L969DRAFT_19050 [Mixia osmundae IAM 14324]KEI37568.1 hypothetical protein L969DRAFT_19050 [Mixia osmundae IAM 14324]GAA93378.1 hypothetical protein E5Q_00018 [Mixia osmundae IAM 14324]